MRKIERLRNWQTEAIQTGRPARYFNLQAPGGAGKSATQVMLAQADIEDTGNKQLILVPKNHIHHGFFDEDAIEFTLPGDDNTSRWQIDSNFCVRSDQKTRLLKEFLLTDVRDLRNNKSLGAIATHRAMAAVWASMNKAEKLAALKHVSFRIDEAHHISNVFDQSELELFNRKDRDAIIDAGTKLGNFVNYVLRLDEPTVKVHLATATFFRGDQKAILSQRIQEDFAHFYLAWDEHFETLGIEHLGVDFLNYKGDPIDAVLSLVQDEPKERHLIIIPALTRRWRTYKSLKTLMLGLYDILPKNKVLDLVTERTQEAHKDLLTRHPEQFNAVVACRLFDEGTDWVPCTRMHNTDACERSLTLSVQRFYRPLRQHPDKKVVQIFNYIPELNAEMPVEEKRQIVSNRLNACLACVVTQGELSPILVNVPSETVDGPDRISLRDLFGDEYPAVITEMIKDYELIEDKNDDQQIEKIADKILDKYDIPGEYESDDVKRALLTQLCRIAMPKSHISPTDLESKAIDADAIRTRGFDKVWKKISPIPSLLCFGSENVDLDTIRELIGIVREIPSLVEIREAIKSFFKRTGERPTFHQAEWITELNRSASAVDKVLRRHFESTLAKEVRIVLGDFNEDLLTKTHDLIRDYWARGIRIGNKYGDLPEIGLTSYALNGRLQGHYGTTLAAEVEKILGSQTKPLTLPKVRQVVRKYLSEGKRITRKTGPIPELDMSSYNLSDRLKLNFNVKLHELVDEVARSV